MENQTVTVRAFISFPHLDTEIMYKGAPTGKYGVQLTKLSDAAVDRLAELDIDVKFKDDKYERGRFIDCKSQFPLDNSGRFPVLYEADGKALFTLPANSIGYGTEVVATLKAFRGRDGVTRPSIIKMNVVELVAPEAAIDDSEVL